MPNLGPIELVLILAVIVIIFGVGRLPEVGGALGRGIREFRRASKDDDELESADMKAKAEAAAASDTNRPSPPPAAEGG